ncbi:ABC transporter ATP-binding protein [Francisella adeliensis]|nr:ATP-binding cassette domain-containing protein [Francisella adeliensis]
MCNIHILLFIMISKPILSVNNLNLTNSKHILFKNISFDLFQGEVLAVMGPSGIGKSMLSKAVAGFLPPSILVEGSIKLNGNEVSQLTISQRTKQQRPAVIFQDALRALNPLVLVGQQLCLALTENKDRLNSKNKKIIISLLRELDFVNPETVLTKYPSQLSGGQRQRICIAISLLGNADFIIADEPTSGLDPIIENKILELFRSRIQQHNISGLLITHDLSTALECDKILIISDNTVIAYGSPRDTIKRSKHPFCKKISQLLLPYSFPTLNQPTQYNSIEIRFEQVNVHYYLKSKWMGGKPFIALDSLDLTIKERNLAVIGPSGAGKSTFIELLFGLRRPSSGEIYIDGYPLSRISVRQHQKLCKYIQLIPQEPQSTLNPFYTVSQILLEPLNNMGILHDQNKKLQEVLNQVGLDLSLLEYHPQQLSVGQAQRVAIARALIIKPSILVADEPTSSLDPISRQQIIDLLTEIKKNHKICLILVTHDFYVAQVLSDEILVLDKGQVVEYDTSQNIVNNPKHPTTRELLIPKIRNNKVY